MTNVIQPPPSPESNDHKLDEHGTSLRVLFSEAHLVSLPLDAYIDLLRTHPTHFLTHVTRQGIRDHGGVFHSAGQGDFHHGFEKILSDKKLQSRFSIHSKHEGLDNAVKDLLRYDLRPDFVRISLGMHKDIDDIRQRVRGALGANNGSLQKIAREYSTRKDAVDAYATKIVDAALWAGNDKQNNAGSVADMLAVHMALEDVADGQYGGETGNEIFIMMPALHIAANHHYNDFHLYSGYSEIWNDVWIWPKDDAGLNVDAGIVFLPKNAQVDPETGSKYLIDADGKPQIYTDYVALLTHGVFDFLKPDEWERLYPLYRTTLYNQNDKNEYQSLRQKICESASRDPRWSDTLQRLFDNEEFISDLIYGVYSFKKSGKNEDIQQTVLTFLRGYKLYYVPAENTIPSQGYWEQYFETHSDQKPSKIVYYEGKDPYEAMNNFRAQHEILIPENTDYPFPENKITKGDAVALRREELGKTLLPIVVRQIEDALKMPSAE